MKRIIILVLIIFSLSSCITYRISTSPEKVKEWKIPDLEGYVTLLCDLHTHTCFSDGYVWPTVRVDEAYKDGLDAVAITDHIEKRLRLYPFYGSSSLNRAYKEALKSKRVNNIIVIKGNEITKTPPGHFNAIFLSDSEKLDHEDFMNNFIAAKEQNAFITWNHPRKEWLPIHTLLFEQGMMQGIEIVNEVTYYPHAHQWALEKNLTMLGNSDIHRKMRLKKGKHRPLTLVFAKDSSPESIHEALLDRRTAVYFNDQILGYEKYLKEIFEKSLSIQVNKIENTVEITFNNDTDLIFILKNEELDSFNIKPNSEHSITIMLSSDTENEINFIIENFIVGPNIPMNYALKL